MPNLVEKNCPLCGVLYAIPFTMNNNRKENGGTWYCPNGHPLEFTKNRSEELQNQLNNTTQLLADKNASLNYHLKLSEGYRNTIKTYKGHVTRLKNNVNE